MCKKYSAQGCNAIQRPTSSDMDNTHRAKTVQKPCNRGLQNKKAMKSFDFTAFSGAMEGTRTPGLLIRRNRMAHFIHFTIQR